MSKAEDLARRVTFTSNNLHEIEIYKQGFFDGYYQAEKDLVSNKDNIMDLLKKKKVQALQDKDDAIEKHDNNSTANADYYSGVAAGLTKAIEIIGMLDKGNKAEKGLELTWEDIKEICDIAFEEACRLQRNMKGYRIYKEQHYKEVLKRFKNLKK